MIPSTTTDLFDQRQLHARACKAVRAAIAFGVTNYDRRRCLPAILPLMPAELEDQSEAMARRIVARLARALRSERQRGIGGHWSYDLNRHMALHQAYEAERLKLPKRSN